MLKKYATAGTGKLGSVTAKVTTNIPEPRCLQEGIDDGVDNDIAVAVALQAGFTRPFKPRQPQRHGRVKLVNIHRCAHALCSRG